MLGATGVALLVACGEDSNDPAISGGTDTTDASTGASGEGTPAAGEPNVFRRSSRHVKNPCNACVAHNGSRYYATAEDAEADLPHEGCNCEVRGQVISAEDAAAYFSDGRTMFDTRSA